MKLDPDERILLTEEDYKCIEEICNEPAPEPSEHMLSAIERYKERVKDKLRTDTQVDKGN